MNRLVDQEDNLKDGLIPLYVKKALEPTEDIDTILINCRQLQQIVALTFKTESG